MVLIEDTSAGLRVVVRRIQLHVPVLYNATHDNNHRQLVRLMRENVEVVAVDDTALLRLAILYSAQRAQGEEGVERSRDDQESDEGENAEHA